MKKTFSNSFSKLGVITSVIAVASTSAMAEGVALPQSIAVAEILGWAGIILVAIAAIWPIKKLIALGNKS